MKKLNLPLILGTIILILILLVMSFPDMFTNNSPYTIQLMRFIHEDGKLSAERAPFPPGEDYLLGSDDLGRDIFSYIIYGTRLTISLGILIAIGQFIIAIPLALLGGFGNRLAKSVIRQSNIIFSAIPALLISIILLKLRFIANLDRQNSIVAFVLIITAVSWPKLGSLISERVEGILQQPFIRGEVAIGKRKLLIALENVLPHLAPELVILFFMEIARNLSMIMQLGIFSIFVGNLGIINDTTSGALINTDISFEPEWASMLSTSRTLVSSAPWAVIFPALAFFISVLGFNLFGEGLRNIIQRKDSRMSLVFRKLISFDLKYVWNMVDRRRKIKFAAAAIIVIGSFAALSLANKGDYSINVESDPGGYPQEVIIGSQGVEQVVESITERMIKLGIAPLREDYVMSYDIGPSFMIEDQRLVIETGDETLQLIPNSDFTFTTSGNNEDQGFVYDATRVDLFNIEDFSGFADKFILMDKAFYNERSIEHFIWEITEKVDIKGILLVAERDERMDSFITDDSDELSVILVSRDVAGILKPNPDSRISIYSSVKPLEPKGRNVVGILMGEDKNIGDEAIVVGLNYNYTKDNGSSLLQFNLELMERLCEQRGNKRSIIFMFLDGTVDEKRHGINYMVKDFPYSPNKVEVYLNLTGLVKEEFDSACFSSAQAPVTRQLAWSLGHHLQKELESKGLDLTQLQTRSVDNEYYFTGSQADNAMFWERGIPTIHVLTGETGEKTRNVEEVGSILLEVINRNNY